MSDTSAVDVSDAKASDDEASDDEVADDESAGLQLNSVANGMEVVTCSICLESLAGSTAIECGHEFHELCLAKWVQRRRGNDCCPVCRAQIHDLRLTALREIDMPGVPARFEEADSDDEIMEDSDDDGWDEEEEESIDGDEPR